MWGDTTQTFHAGELERGSQLVEGVSAVDGRDEWCVWFKDIVDLGQY